MTPSTLLQLAHIINIQDKQEKRFTIDNVLITLFIVDMFYVKIRKNELILIALFILWKVKTISF